jgi:type II secretion system protein H
VADGTTRKRGSRPKATVVPTGTTRKRGSRPKGGFTLLEVLLVITLVALLATAALPSLGNLFRASVGSALRRYSALVRYAYDQAVLTGRVHRIVLNLDDSTWKIESADPGALPLEKTRLGIAPESLREEDRIKIAGEPAFRPIKGNLVDQVPRGVKIVEVVSWRTGKDPITKGETSLYAFPNGMIDEATVTLSEEGKEDVTSYKLLTLPLTGRVTIETETAQ